MISFYYNNLARGQVFLYACWGMHENFKKQIAIPQDHGSWVFILSPLIVGIFAGGNFNYATFCLFIGAMSAFMIRQPMTVYVKAISGRRPKSDLAPARFWVLIYGSIAALAFDRAHPARLYLYSVPGNTSCAHFCVAFMARQSAQ